MKSSDEYGLPFKKPLKPIDIQATVVAEVTSSSKKSSEVNNFALDAFPNLIGRFKEFATSCLDDFYFQLTHVAWLTRPMVPTMVQTEVPATEEKGADERDIEARDDSGIGDIL